MWTKEEIGLAIKNTRQTTGLTQSQVAKALGRPQQTIANWEVGRSQPDANTLFELFKLLGADLNTSFGFFPSKKETPFYTSEALQLATDYDSLDDHGKKIVRLVADEEKARITDKAAKLQAGRKADIEAAEEVEHFPVPIYLLPMSAGTGQETGQEYPEDFLLKKRPPRGTSFIARVNGNSMEPTYHNEDLVFVHAIVDIQAGQIGAFLMDGQLWIKELGDGVLISHNPNYEPILMQEDIRCQGLVLGVCDKSYLE